MADAKVTYPVNEVIGMSKGVMAMLTKYKTQMVAAKIDPTDKIASLDPDADGLADERDKQKGLQTAEREQTKIVNAKSAALYNSASNGCDMVITAFGKNSEEAKEAMNLRKSVRPVKHSSGDNPTPTPPAS